jgi:hypothetical protein
MGATGWLQRNLFEYPLLAVLLLELASRIRWELKQGEIVCSTARVRSRRRWRILLLGFVCLSGYLVFEIYYRFFHCTTSAHYQRENSRIAIQTMALLQTLSVSFWLEKASLLNYLRNETISRWDHDTDFGIMHPGASKLTEIREAIESSPLHLAAHWDETRDLLQVYRYSKKQKASGYRPSKILVPHSDIWLNTIERIGSETFMRHKDFTATYRHRSVQHVLPLRNALWLNHNTSIPACPHAISELEFGEGYLVPLTYRADCVHNIFNGRMLY